MPVAAKDRKNKHFLLDNSRLKKAQKILGTKTETETIEIALEKVITEAERNKKAWAAQSSFMRSAAKEQLIIEDVFGHLNED